MNSRNSGYTLDRKATLGDTSKDYSCNVVMKCHCQLIFNLCDPNKAFGLLSISSFYAHTFGKDLNKILFNVFLKNECSGKLFVDCGVCDHFKKIT